MLGIMLIFSTTLLIKMVTLNQTCCLLSAFLCGSHVPTEVGTIVLIKTKGSFGHQTLMGLRLATDVKSKRCFSGLTLST